MGTMTMAERYLVPFTQCIDIERMSLVQELLKTLRYQKHSLLSRRIVTEVCTWCSGIVSSGLNVRLNEDLASSTVTRCGAVESHWRACNISDEPRKIIKRSFLTSQAQQVVDPRPNGSRSFIRPSSEWRLAINEFSPVARNFKAWLSTETSGIRLALLARLSTLGFTIPHWGHRPISSRPTLALHSCTRTMLS